MTQAEVEKYSKFFGKDWTLMLSSILASKDYRMIGEELTRQKKSGIDITPGFNNIFRAFKECPLHRLHTIIIGQDVYPTKTENNEYTADGIAFSSRVSTEPPPSLEIIFRAIEDSVYEGDYTPSSVFNYHLSEATWDLTPWACQGILMINCAFTTVVGRPNEHLNLWKPFTQMLVNEITTRKNNLGIALLGSHARDLKDSMNPNTHYIQACEHPAASIYHKRKWFHNDIFKELTDFQKKRNNITIQW